MRSYLRAGASQRAGGPKMSVGAFMPFATPSYAIPALDPRKVLSCVRVCVYVYVCVCAGPPQGAELRACICVCVCLCVCLHVCVWVGRWGLECAPHYKRACVLCQCRHSATTKGYVSVPPQGYVCCASATLAMDQWKVV